MKNYKMGEHLKNEIRQRRTAIPHDERKAMELSDKSLWDLNNEADMFAMLGLGIGAEGEVTDSKAKSKFFIMRQDDDGTLRRVSLDEAGITPKSRAFWQEAQLGNLFVYAAGSPNPSQIQLDYRANSKSLEPAFSKPVDPAAVTALGRVKKPNFFKRLLNRFNKDWFKAECEPWRKQEESAAKLRENLSKETGERKNTAAQELEEVAGIEKATAEAERKAKLDRMVQSAQARLERTAIGTKYSEAIFEPEPKIFATEETLERFPGRTTDDPFFNKLLRIESKQFGFMDMDEFANLTPFGKDQLDLDAITLGESGRPVSKSEFCSLALFTCMENEIALNAHKEGPAMIDSYDPTLLPRLQEVVGLSKEEAETLVALSGSSFYTTDTFIDPPRSESGRFIADTINIGRKKTAEALAAYQNGDLAPLGKLLANGVNKQAGTIAQVEAHSFGSEIEGGFNSSRHLIDMLKADPRLKDAALKAGMEEKNLRVVEGVGKLCELDEKACEANLKLAKAERDGVALSAEEKMECIKSVVMPQLAYHMMLTENKNTECKEIQHIMSEKFLNYDLMPSSEVQHDLKRRVSELPDKMLWADSILSTQDAMKAVYRRKPESIAALRSATGMENLEKTAAEIIRQDKLAELSPGELVKKFNMLTSAYGDPGYGERGLEIMQRQGMLTPEVKRTIQQELRLGITEKTASAAATDAPEKRAELSKADHAASAGV